MNTTFLSRAFALLIGAASFSLIHTKGQSTSGSATTVVVNVQGLTSEMRDGLSQDLRQKSAIKLVYACVPAGILIFEHGSARSRTDAQHELLPLLQHRIARQRIEMDMMDRQSAEQSCANVRNQ